MLQQAFKVEYLHILETQRLTLTLCLTIIIKKSFAKPRISIIAIIDAFLRPTSCNEVVCFRCVC